AGSFYWKSHANDSSNQWNMSDEWTFTIQKSEGVVNLYLNGSTGDYKHNLSFDVNITCSLSTPSTGNITIYENNAVIVSRIDSVVNVTRTYSSIADYNISCIILSHQNYTAYNFSWINATDEIIPTTTLNTPASNYYNDTSDTVNVTFNCSATDDNNLANISLYITNSQNQSFSLNQTTSISGTSNSTTWTLNLSNGNYTWNCIAYDAAGNSDWDDNRSILINYTAPDTTAPNLIINKPTAIENESTFYINMTTSSDAVNCMFNVLYIDSNSDSSLGNSTNITESLISIGNAKSCVYLTSFRNSNYTLTIYVNDSSGNMNVSGINFKMNDTIEPMMEFNSTSNVTVTTTTATISFTSSEYVNATIISGTTVLGSNISFDSKDKSITLSSLSSGTTYRYNLTSCDYAGNCVVNGTYNFTTSSSGGSTPPASSSGGGGGGGGGSIKIENNYDITSELGKDKSSTKTLREGGYLTYKYKKKNHTIKVIKIEYIKRKIILEIASTPRIYEMNLSHTLTIDLDNDSYDDISIKMDDIKFSSATLTVKSLADDIPEGEIEIAEEETNQTIKEEEIVLIEETVEEYLPGRTGARYWIIVVILVVIIVVFTSYLWIKWKDEKELYELVKKEMGRQNTKKRKK
ncbi:MAG: hypothetical protein KAK00_10875, partial [Nanoarchaeota archaeon]|nr:hypothetical protein [Nanoarchaeota archaeon]